MDIEDPYLRQDIDAFFMPRVHNYLNQQIKRLKATKRPFSPSHALGIIRNFEEEIHHLQSLSPPDNDYKATLDLWKKTFTRNILVPKYLIKNPHIDLEQVIALIKQSLLLACQEAKTEAYVRSFKQTIVNSLRNTPPLERMKRARQVLSSSLKVIQKIDKNFSKDLLLSAFSKNHLQELVDEADHPAKTLQPASSQENHDQRLVKRRIRAKPKFTGVDPEKLQAYLKQHLMNLVEPTLRKTPSLLGKLQVVSQLFNQVSHKDLLTWLTSWHEKPLLTEEDLLKATSAELPSAIKQIRAEVLAANCLEEISAAKSQVSFTAFAKEREAIIERYIRMFLQEDSLRKLFLEALKESERTERERYLPPHDDLPPTQPLPQSKKSLWQRV